MESQFTISCSQARLLVVEQGCIQLSMASHRKSQTVYPEAKTKNCSLKTNTGTPLLTTMSTKCVEHEKVKKMLPWSLHHYFLVSLVQEGILLATKRETWTLAHPQSLGPTIWLHCRILAQNVWEDPTNVWLDFGLTHYEEPHTRHCLGNQEPETRYSRDLG